jgi:aldehyde dehydrogenase
VSPGLPGALDNAHKSGLKTRYGNFISGTFVDRVQGRYFTDHSPIYGEKLADIARSSPKDVELALDAAHAAKKA